MRTDLESELGGLIEGDRRSLARLITLVENRSEGWLDVLGRAYALERRALIVGLTGPGGVGKSTLVSAMATRLVGMERKVAVIAIDPSSPVSSGAFLGDRIRLDARLASKIYFRSMASRGAAGGVAAAVSDVIQLLSASGRDIVLVETVGAGQDQVDIARIADITALVCSPGFGDRIQTLKAGVLEVADCFIVNKADKEGADQTAAELRSFLHHLPDQGAEDQIPVFKVVATSGENVESVCNFMLERESRALSRPHGEADAIERAIHLWKAELEAHARRRLKEQGSALDFRMSAAAGNPYVIAESVLFLESMRYCFDRLLSGKCREDGDVGHGDEGSGA